MTMKVKENSGVKTGPEKEEISLPGVVPKGREEPLHTAGQSLPVPALLEELGIPLEEVRQALEEGGYI